MPKRIGSLTLYSIKELSEELEATPETLRTYIAKGRMKGQKIGQKWYVLEESLKEFFAGQNGPGAPKGM